MSAVARALPRTRPRARTRAVVRSLALAESRRMLRNPVLWACTGLSVWMMWSVVPTPDEWPGASYEEMATCAVPLLFAVSVVAAVSFNRERLDVAADAPVTEVQRCVGRWVGALPLLAVAAGYAALLAWRQRDLGGLWLGTEPGRTTEALFTAGELVQPVVLALLAVSTGAALGRRLPLVSALPLLFVLWFLVAFYWLFGAAAVVPLSILQVQPVRVFAGTPYADPLRFPSQWLLEAPGEFSEQWSRVVVSAGLSWWHAVWLLGLSALWGAVTVPRGRARRWLVAAGSVLAVVGVVAQYWVLP
ncbi:hypothetical protein [Nocardioides sp. Soil805]|uniref:hypothetical protein n=1 Tax=Nocardioides sp. Soil805 TaxID=1736416 RepID=UPI000714F389|nr:hypothetical protein [Nocardioides sp. Soil805]KRF34264.1 hypothetical protein ASG94_16220 [Nocardioides sp. Soil805]